MPRALFLLLALGLAGTVAAQTPIRVGQTLEGRLEASDARGADGAYYDTYAFRAETGGTITVFLRSTDFDAYLHAGTGTGDAWTESDTDDDGAGGLDSRLVLRLDAGESVVLRASALSEGATGAYTLSVEEGEVGGADVGDLRATDDPITIDPARIRTIHLDTSETGTFAENSDVLYRFTPATSGMITVVVDSADFDAMLQVGTLDGATFTPTLSDDDSGESTNPLVVVEAEAGEPLLVRVLGYHDGGGRFSLLVREGDQTGDYADPEDGWDTEENTPVEVDPAQIVTLGLDTPVSGAVAAGSGVLYRFTPAATGTYTVVVDTSDFDAMLQVGTLEGTTFTPTLSDDDSGRDVNPLLIVEGVSGVPVLVRVLGFADEEGRFDVRVREGNVQSLYADPEEAFGTRLDFSTATTVPLGTTRRSVAAASPALEWDEHRRYDLLRFDAPAAGTYTLVVTSDAFDPTLEVGQARDSMFVFTTGDDDAGVGRAAALVADLEEGPYYLRVVSDTLRRGAYTLEVLQGDHSEHYLEASMPDRVQIARAVPVRTGQTLAGMLDASDPEDLPWDSATDLYLFEAQAGQSVTIEVESDDLDPYVEVGSLDGDVFSNLASDDDGMGEGLNSRLQFTFERTGRYLIRISAINEVLGRYTLRVR